MREWRVWIQYRSPIFHSEYKSNIHGSRYSSANFAVCMKTWSVTESPEVTITGITGHTDFCSYSDNTILTPPSPTANQCVTFVSSTDEWQCDEFLKLCSSPFCSNSSSAPPLSPSSLHFSLSCCLFSPPLFSPLFPLASLPFALPLGPCPLLCSRRRWYACWSRWTSSSWWCRWPWAAQSPCTCSRRPSSSRTSEPSRRRSVPGAPVWLGLRPPWQTLLRCTEGWWGRTGSSRRVARASKHWWTWSNQPWESREEMLSVTRTQLFDSVFLL